MKWSVDRDNITLGDEFLNGVLSDWTVSSVLTIEITLRSKTRFAPTALAASTM